MSASDHDASRCRILQEEELEVLEVCYFQLYLPATHVSFFNLQSIYPDYISREASKGLDMTIFLEVPIHLPHPHRLIITCDTPETSTFAEAASSPPTEGTISDLPPILLQVLLPDSYPLHSPPQILSLHATHSWAPRLRVVIDQLLASWQAGEGVLYNWIEIIESGRFMHSLELMKNDDTIW
jgi:E3 ubiquitin-protein ligase RNF14